MKHLGPVLPAMLLISLVTAAAIVARPPPPALPARVWVFSDAHAATFREAARVQNLDVQVEQLSYRALELRLLSMSLSPEVGGEMLEVAAIEIGSIGKFLRPPTADVGLLPLNHHIRTSPAAQSILPSRLALAAKDGVVFGIPDDVHPVAIAYRADLFDSVGVDLSAADTWTEFHSLCLVAQERWRAAGNPERVALELPRNTPEWLLVMLMQRGINPLDQNNRVHLHEDAIADTLLFYASLIAGNGRISQPPGPGTFNHRDIAAGRVAAWFCPDWRPAYLRKYVPELAGKIRLMPLPRFSATDAPTATWGGTVLVIPRNVRDPDAAWHRLEALALSDAAIRARMAHTDVLPPLTSAWPAIRAAAGADSYFRDPVPSLLYLDLAEAVPPRVVTAFTPLMQVELAEVMSQTVDDVASNVPAAEARRRCLERLAAAQASLERYIEFGQFDPTRDSTTGNRR